MVTPLHYRILPPMYGAKGEGHTPNYSWLHPCITLYPPYVWGEGRGSHPELFIYLNAKCSHGRAESTSISIS